jgi:hypothetical protein
MLQEGNQWNVLQMTGEPGRWHTRRTNVYRLSEDTVIDGKHYAAVLKSTDRDTTTWETAGFIREDITAKRVYHRALFHYSRGDSITPECVLYDFGVSVGDTVTTIWPDSIRNIVKGIDSIEINGKYHKRITVGNQFVGEEGQDRPLWINEWIEGIGNINGLLYTNASIPCSCIYELLAFIQNDEVVYNPFDYDTDFIWWTVSNEPVETESPVTVFASGRTLHILYADAGDYAVDVFSIAGTHLLHRQCNTDEIAVSLPAVPAGVYVVRITSGTYSLSKKIYLN